MRIYIIDTTIYYFSYCYCYCYYYDCVVAAAQASIVLRRIHLIQRHKKPAEFLVDGFTLRRGVIL